MNQLRKLIAKILYSIFTIIEIQAASVQLICSLETSLIETILEHGQSVDGETGKRDVAKRNERYSKRKHVIGRTD